MKRLKIILLITLLTAGISFSYLVTKTSSTTNTINEAEITCVSHLTKDDQNITAISIENTSDSSCFIRFRIIPYYKENNQIQYKTPDNQINILSDCKCINNYYYYPDLLQANQSTTNLITSYIDTDNDLYVDVIAEAIQANNSDALKELWHVDTDDFITI